MRNVVFKNLPKVIGQYQVKRDPMGKVIIVGATQPFKFVEFKLDTRRSKYDWRVAKYENGELHLECVK